MDEETIQQLRLLLSSTKERLFHAERIIDLMAPDHILAMNYVEKHHKEMNDLRGEFTKQIPSTNENEPPIGQSHDANGRLV